MPDPIAPTIDELTTARAFWDGHLAGDDVPFSCRLDGQPLDLNDGHWQVDRTDAGLEAFHAGHGLRLRCRGKCYGDFPVVEWTVELEQTATGKPPLITELLGLDCRWQAAEGNGFAVRGHKGDTHEQGDLYAPWRSKILQENRGLSIAPTWGHGLIPTGGEFAAGRDAHEREEGRPCSGAFPFFAVEEWNQALPGDAPAVRGFVLAVGWPGRWRAEFSGDTDRRIRVRAGQEDTAFRLRPGESVRTPLIALLLFEGGDRVRVQNLWRRWMLAHNLSRPGGKLPAPMLEGSSCGFLEEMGRADAANQMDFLDRYRAARLPIDCWWMDAGWYPCWFEGKNCWGKIGTWEADPKRFPHGIRAITDHAHRMGIKSVLWFEPERVTPGTWLHDQRPQWLLLGRNQKVFQPGQAPVTADDFAQGARLFDLGNEEARAWLIEHIGNLIEREGLDVYRQDFNCNPLSYWRDHDAPERVGLTENRHVVGYLKFWDALLARFPHLLIDSCASGGRRNDLETLRRGVALHPTDYRYEDLPVKQAIRHSLFQWMPYFGGPVLPLDKVDAYAFRSAMGLSTVVGFDLRRDDLDLELLRKLMTEWHEVAECYYGDYYPLTPYSRDEQNWMAWQFHRPEQGDGLIQVFRRAESPIEAASFPLRGLDPDARYVFHDFDVPDDTEHRGADLASGWRIAIPARRTARLIRYRRQS
jgi:alpha-galactosidase